MGNTYPNHKGNSYYRNHTLYHIGTSDPLGKIPRQLSYNLLPRMRFNESTLKTLIPVDLIQSTIILVMGSPKMIPPILGKPHISPQSPQNWRRLSKDEHVAASTSPLFMDCALQGDLPKSRASLLGVSTIP